MLSFSLLLLLFSAQWCSAQYNASTLTASGQLDAAVSQIAASYFPSSIQPSLAIALVSASVTGDINSVVTSFITAASPPPFVTNAALAPYSSRIAKAESLISSLRAGVYSATHTTANNTISANGTLGIVTTETASNGSAVVTTLPAHVVNGSTVEGAATTSGGAAPSTPATTTPAAPATSSSSGFALPTQVPASAAAVLGLLGVMAAL